MTSTKGTILRLEERENALTACDVLMRAPHKCMLYGLACNRLVHDSANQIRKTRSHSHAEIRGVPERLPCDTFCMLVPAQHQSSAEYRDRSCAPGSPWGSTLMQAQLVALSGPEHARTHSPFPSPLPSPLFESQFVQPTPSVLELPIEIWKGGRVCICKLRKHDNWPHSFFIWPHFGDYSGREERDRI